MYEIQTPEVLRLHTLNYSVREIARITGIPKSTVERMIKREWME